MATPAIETGREAFQRRAWRLAYQHLSAAATESTLEVDDLERLAMAGHLVAATDWADGWTRAHDESARSGDTTRAARCAFWLAYGLIDRGEIARGSGWLARAQKLIGDRDCVERGYLLIPQAIGCFTEDPAAALDLFEAANRVGDQFADAGLCVLSQMGQGQALIALGRCAEALTLLDEAIVAVSHSDLPPLVVGNVLCGAIDACRGILDVRRTREWTIALNRWCDAQSDLVPFRGECLVHRAEIMQLHGDWPDALDEADRACHLLAGRTAVGEGLYRVGELHRLRGRFDDAEAAYRASSHAGREPQPGLALLRLAQGQRAAAVAAMRRIAGEGSRPRVENLVAYVEIMLDADDLDAASAGAEELKALAAATGADFPRAAATGATGAVHLARGQPTAALAPLRRAWTAWQHLEIPYEAARIRVLIGRACQALGDHDGAEMEFEAARLGFTALGAATDLVHLDALSRPRAQQHRGLSRRELEVLALVAKGSSNREIAATLVISEHTVARHVQNILAKLDVPSRTAAGAYAFEHRLT
jgi:DNA-binding CsgD family transcriptional regulator